MKGIDNHINQLFKKYFGGNANRLEMRKLEQAAESDLYLRDAKEGIDKLSKVDRETAIAELQYKLAKRTSTRQNKIEPLQWIKLAAGIVILLSAGFYIWQPAKNNNMAEGKAIEKNATPQLKPAKTKKIVQSTDAKSIALEGDTNPFDIANANNTGIDITTPQDEAKTTIEKHKESKIKPDADVLDYALTSPIAEAKPLRKTARARDDATSYAIDGVAIKENLPAQLEEVAMSDVEDTKHPSATVNASAFSIETVEVQDSEKAEATQQNNNLPTRSNSDLAEASTTLGAEVSKKQSSSAASPIKDDATFQKFIEDNLQIPDAARQNNIKGKVILLFNVNTAGRPTDIEVKKSLGYGCDEEAIRLLKEGPDWEEGNRERKTKIAIMFK